jgi:NAD(P)-dependent dehydrogenase (short-subunit alcohol dehydrogenase family)
LTEARTVVVTGASRGLGRATAAHLHRAGWTVAAAMRNPDRDLGGLLADARAADGDPRLIPVRLDLDDEGSIAAAAGEIVDRVGSPHGVVHVAGVAGVGSLEEMPFDEWAQIVSTNLFGPVRLTKALLPSMRAAGRGRIVLVSSQGAVRGMPAIGAYSAAKGGLERWGESLAFEVAPFGLGVSIIVTGTFRTDILELTTTWEDTSGPYAPMHLALRRTGDRILRIARPPRSFAPAVERALADTGAFRRRAVGIDARLLLLGSRLLPGRLLERATRLGIGIPAPRSLQDDPRRLAPVVPDIDHQDLGAP